MFLILINLFNFILYIFSIINLINDFFDILKLVIIDKFERLYKFYYRVINAKII